MSDPATAAPGTRVLVCGGRDVIDSDFVWSTLDAMHAARPMSLVISGGARGADTLAELWAARRGIPVDSHPVTHHEWQTIGRGAGHARNRRMLDVARPEVVVAFPGGAGTRDMVRRAEAAGVPVVRVPYVPSPAVAAALSGGSR